MSARIAGALSFGKESLMTTILKGNIVSALELGKLEVTENGYLIAEDGIITGETADAVLNYMKAIEDATTITEDIDARYDAFANAEASLINNALVIPMGMSVPKYLATRLNYWEGQYASTGFSNKRLKGIHVLDHYVSMDEYNANRDAR